MKGLTSDSSCTAALPFLSSVLAQLASLPPNGGLGCPKVSIMHHNPTLHRRITFRHLSPSFQLVFVSLSAAIVLNAHLCVGGPASYRQGLPDSDSTDTARRAIVSEAHPRSLPLVFDPSQRFALIDLYEATAGTGWTNRLGGTSGRQSCSLASQSVIISRRERCMLYAVQWQFYVEYIIMRMASCSRLPCLTCSRSISYLSLF